MYFIVAQLLSLNITHESDLCGRLTGKMTGNCGNRCLVMPMENESYKNAGGCAMGRGRLVVGTYLNTLALHTGCLTCYCLASSLSRSRRHPEWCVTDGVPAVTNLNNSSACHVRSMSSKLDSTAKKVRQQLAVWRSTLFTDSQCTVLLCKRSGIQDFF